MTTLSLRLPESLHRGVKELAKQDGISINQFIAVAVAELTRVASSPAGDDAVRRDAAGVLAAACKVFYEGGA